MLLPRTFDDFDNFCSVFLTSQCLHYASANFSSGNLLVLVPMFMVEFPLLHMNSVNLIFSSNKKVSFYFLNCNAVAFFLYLESS